MIAAIVLAAGQSRRMGTQKLLLPFAGQTIIGHVLDEITQSRCDSVFVIVRPQSPLRNALSQKNARLLENSDEQGDMLSSVRIGLNNVPQQCAAAVITPGDFPLLQTELINQMIEAFHATNQMIVPVYEGQRGHPLLVPRRYFGAVLTNYDSVGLRGLLQEYATEVYELTVENSGVLQDMDVLDDYQKVLKESSSL